MEKKKTGCPHCGKPTSGTPTDKGFQWAICDDCLARMEAEEQGSAPSDGTKLSAGPPAKNRPGNKPKGK